MCFTFFAVRNSPDIDLYGQAIIELTDVTTLRSVESHCDVGSISYVRVQEVFRM